MRTRHEESTAGHLPVAVPLFADRARTAALRVESLRGLSEASEVAAARRVSMLLGSTSTALGQARQAAIAHAREAAAAQHPRDPQRWDDLAEVAAADVAPRYRRLADALRVIADITSGRTTLGRRAAARALAAARDLLAFRIAGPAGPSTPRTHAPPDRQHGLVGQLLDAPGAPPLTRGSLASA